MKGWARRRSVARTKLAALGICCVVIGMVALVAGPSRVTLPERTSGLGLSAASLTPVGFALGLNVSGFSIGMHFTTTFNLSGGIALPGQHLAASATLAAPSSTDLNISYLGKSATLALNPLGSLTNLAIPGISYNYQGLAQLGLYLNLSGTVLGNSTVSGPASGGGSQVAWTGSGAQIVALSIWSNATNGSTVAWSVASLAYGFSLGIVAVGTVFGYGVSVPLIHFGSLGLFPGNPASVNATYTVPGHSTGTGGGGGGPGWFLGNATDLWIGIVLLVVIIAVIIAAAVASRNGKPRKPSAPPSVR